MRQEAGLLHRLAVEDVSDGLGSVGAIVDRRLEHARILPPCDLDQLLLSETKLASWLIEIDVESPMSSS